MTGSANNNATMKCTKLIVAYVVLQIQIFFLILYK